MSEAFRKLAGGFKLVYIGLVIVVLAVILGGVGGGVIGGMQAAQQQPGQQPPPAFGARPQGPVLVLTAVVGAVAFVGGVLGLIGRIRCTAVPDEIPGAKGMIVASVVLEVIALLIGVVNNIDQVAVGALPPPVQAGAGMVSGVFNVAAAILFLLFTAAVARYVRRPDLAKSARTVLILYAILMVLLLLLAGVAVFLAVSVGVPGAPGGPPAAGGPGGPPDIPKDKQAMVAGLGIGICGLACVAIPLGLTALVLYARLLIGMSAACLRYADGPPPAEDDYGDRDDDRDEREYDADFR